MTVLYTVNHKVNGNFINYYNNLSEWLYFIDNHHKVNGNFIFGLRSVWKSLEIYLLEGCEFPLEMVRKCYNVTKKI